jgi:hypothetical protein
MNKCLSCFYGAHDCEGDGCDCPICNPYDNGRGQSLTPADLFTPSQLRALFDGEANSVGGPADSTRRPGRPSTPCPCCGLEDPRLYHLALAQDLLRILINETGGLSQAAVLIAERTRQQPGTIARKLHRIQAGQHAPQEPFLDILRTMTGTLAPYQIQEVN